MTRPPSTTTPLTGARVAVTGASGFCGAAVARLAACAGADVVCLGRSPGPVGQHIRWDAARDVPDLAGADVVIHLAAAVGDSPAIDYHSVNVDGAVRLLVAARSRPMIWVSSASVYDPRHDRSLVREDHPIGGQLSGYGHSKALGDQLALEHGAVVLRPRAVYGPGDPYLLPRLRRSVRRGFALLPGPDVQLSLTSVQNLADACLAALDWPPGAYNVADAQPYHRDRTVAQVLAAYGIPARVRHVPLPAAVALARAAEALTRFGSWQPALSRYALDQIGHPVVLDLTKVLAQGWDPRHDLAGYLAELGRSSHRTGSAQADPASNGH